MLWVDKHRPTSLSGKEGLSHSPSLTARLELLTSTPASRASLPHLLLYGPPGSGKRTRVRAILRVLFGPGAERLRLDRRSCKTPSGKEVEVDAVCSNYHVELCPADAGSQDRLVAQDVISEIASSGRSIASVGTTTDIGGEKRPQYKVVVLHEVDRLTKQAQAALRRTMEKHTSSCRLILVCNSQSRVIGPVRSRCLGIRVAAPTIDEISTILRNVHSKECPGRPLPAELAVNIARSSGRNLRRAVLALEAAHVTSGGSPQASQPIPKTDWEAYIAQLAADLAREQSPQRLLAARERIYELLINCVPGDVILKTLVRELLKTLDDEMKGEVVKWAAFYEHRLSCGVGSGKEIFHLEAFMAKYMALYKRYLNNLFG